MRDPERTIRNGSAIASRPWSPGPDPGSRIPILKILSAEFVTSAAAAGRADDVPADGIAQVAFAGRSNVGKSTLLNALAARTLARTSAAPGKTRLANIYRLQVEGGPGGPGRWSVYFVDLPGYGYARGGADAARELAAVAQAYFASGSRLATRGSPERSSSGTHDEPSREPPAPDRDSLSIFVATICGGPAAAVSHACAC